MFKNILIGIAVIVAAVIGFAYVLPRQVHVERSIVIQAPQATVFALVNGYKIFNKWSPWAAKDPNAAYTYEGPDFGEGAKMSWAGDPKTVGSGSQTIVESRPHDAVETALDFGSEGVATAQFLLSPDAGATKVVWSVDIDLGMSPIGRYFGLMFDKMIGPDYEEGLAGLKTLAESLPKADFAGLSVQVVQTQPVRVAYVETSSGKGEQEIAAAIGGAYAEVGKFMKANGLAQAGPPMTINTKWDDGGYVFDAAFPVDAPPAKEVAADSRVKVKETHAGKALKVVHTGAYREMEKTYDGLFAWAAAHGYEQAGPPWDEYVSDPGNTPEAELTTNVVLPVK